MARTPLRTYTFDILDQFGESVPGCVVTYNREDGYGWQTPYAAGDADSRDEAEVAALESLRASLAAQVAARVPTLDARPDDDDAAAAGVAVPCGPTPPSGGPTWMVAASTGALITGQMLADMTAPDERERLAALLAALSVDEQREASLLLARHTAQQTGRRVVGVGFVVR